MQPSDLPTTPEVLDIFTRSPYITANEPLGSSTTSFGGGDGGSMDPTVSIKEYVDARNDAIESRLSTKLDRLPSTATVWGAVAAIVGAIFTAVTIVLASLSFAGDRFDGGISVSPTIEKIRADQAKTDNNQDTKLELMNDKLDVIIQQTSK